MKSILLSALILTSLVFPLGAAYPDFSTQSSFTLPEVAFASPSLDPFLTMWANPALSSLASLQDMLEREVEATSLDLDQLQYVVGLQKAQLDYARQSARPKLGLSATPYAYTDSRPVGSPTKTHSFSVGGTLTQSLPTAGTLSVGVKQSSSYNIDKTAWTQTPSVTVSLQQPLFVGSSLLETSYQKDQLEKQSNKLSSATMQADSLKRTLVVQNARLLHLRQSLLENRFLIGERAKLAEQAVRKASMDLEQGLISRQAYENRLISYYQLASSYDEVERELINLNATLQKTFTGNAPGEVSVSPGFDPFSLAKYTEDTQTLLERYLAKSASYQSALLELRSATLDSGYYSLSDAPQLQLSLSYSPYYVGTEKQYFSSFSELFTDGEMALSFSIGFSATDLFRRSSALQQKSAELALLGSKAKVEQALEQASDELELLVKEVRSFLIDLLIQLEEYQLKRAIYEAEQIRFEANLIDSSALKQKELDWYQAAFTVLSTLRELELRSMQMQLLGLLT